MLPAHHGVRFLHADDSQDIMDDLTQQQPYIWLLGSVEAWLPEPTTGMRKSPPHGSTVSFAASSSFGISDLWLNSFCQVGWLNPVSGMDSFLATTGHPCPPPAVCFGVTGLATATCQDFSLDFYCLCVLSSLAARGLV